jgi:hypothetical protein
LISLDESIGKIEVNPKEEASVVEVFQDVFVKPFHNVQKQLKCNVMQREFSILNLFKEFQ